MAQLNIRFLSTCSSCLFVTSYSSRYSRVHSCISSKTNVSLHFTCKIFIKKKNAEKHNS